MRLLRLEKTGDGRFLKSYVLVYENKDGKEKRYEIVSHNELESPDSLGQKTSGVSMCGFSEDKMLLLREFRMGVNKYIYNLCSGIIEPGEDLSAAMNRELYEETGLSIKRIIEVMPPAYAAVAISDIKTQVALIEVQGNIESHGSANEDIKASLYTREQVKELLETEDFSTRSQAFAYLFSKGYIGADKM